MQQNPRS